MSLDPFQLERARSLLFVPALERRFVERAHTRGAGAIILDLEDSIAATMKEQARLQLAGSAACLRANGVRHVVVRVNAGVDEDVAAAVHAGADAVLVPKVEDIADVEQAASARGAPDTGTPALILLVETPKAVCNLRELAAHPRVLGLVLGSEDLAMSLGVEPTSEALLHTAQQIVMAARAAGKVPLGVPGSLASLDPNGDFGTSLALAARIGMAGAVCIHPNQVGLANAAFRPAEEAIAQARRVLIAFEEGEAAGKGAVSLDGKMLDRPIVERARMLVAMVNN